MGCTGDADAGFAADNANLDLARAAHIHALDDRERGGLADLAELPQVAAERSSRSARGRILDHSAAGEWVAGVIALLGLGPDQLQRYQRLVPHQLGKSVEVVVQLGQPQ